MSQLDLDRLMTLERRGWDSLCESAGGGFYGQLMTPDGLMVLVNGMTMDRAAVVDALNGSPPWHAYELSDERLVPVGPDSAALVYRARATRDGSEPFEAIMTSVYTVVAGTPRLALYQQTAVPH